MTRDLTAGMISELTAATVRPFFLYEGVFAVDTVRLWDGYGDLIWDGDTYLGNGWLQGFSDFPESNEVQATGTDVFLSGVPLALISLLLTESQHNCRGSIYLGFFDEDRVIVEDPYLLFEGALSAPRVDDSSDTSRVVLSYENDLIMLARSKELRWNNESQRALFPTDRGFEYVASIQKWTGFWGLKEKPKPVKPPKKNKSSRK